MMQKKRLVCDRTPAEKRDEMKAKLPADEWLTVWTDFESAAVRGAVIETDTVKAFGLSGEIQWKDDTP